MKQMNKKQLFTCLITACFCTLMSVCAVCFHEMELFFPEITALCIGALVMEKQPWNVSKLQMILVMTISACIGVLLNSYAPYSLYVKTMLGLLCCAILIVLFKTTMAPLISACILPIYLHTTSWIYPISVFSMVAFIILLQWSFERNGIIQKRTYAPTFNTVQSIYEWAIRLLCLGAVLSLPLIKGQLFFVVPPLLVIFTELSKKESKPRTKPFLLFLLAFLSTSIGILCNLVLIQRFGLSLPLATLLAVFLLLLIQQTFSFFFPPLGALCLLAFLLPANQLYLYPLESTCGLIILYLISLLFAKLPELQMDKEALTPTDFDDSANLL